MQGATNSHEMFVCWSIAYRNSLTHPTPQKWTVILILLMITPSMMRLTVQ